LENLEAESKTKKKTAGNGHLALSQNMWQETKDSLVVFRATLMDCKIKFTSTPMRLTGDSCQWHSVPLFRSFLYNDFFKGLTPFVFVSCLVSWP
jgi:hypothetical protein